MEPKHAKPKMSQILLEYASDYISMGSTLQQKQAYLDSAVLAWNLSLFPEGERREQLRERLEELEALNFGSKNVDSLRYNLPILIERRLAKFPQIEKLIVNAQISIVGGKECLNVVSTDFQETKR